MNKLKSQPVLKNDKDKETLIQGFFHLMVDFCQLRQKEKIIDEFIDAVNKFWPNCIPIYQPIKIIDEENIFEISTFNSNYGYIRIENPAVLTEDDLKIIHDVVCFLAIIIRKNEQDRFLADENEHVQQLVDERVIFYKANETKYRNIFENIQDVYYETSLDGTILEISPSISHLSRGQYSREDVLGKTITGFYADKDVEQKILSEIFEKKFIDDFEVTLVNRDGSLVYCSIISRVFFDDQGIPIKLIGSIRDITSRKLAEKAQSQLLFIIESSLNEIYIFNPVSLLFEYVNQGALRNLGYTLEEMKKMTPMDLKPEFTETSYRQKIEPLIRHEQEKLVFNTIHQRADESLYPVEVHLQLVELENRQAFLAIIIDISERKRSKDALRDSEEQIRLINQLSNHLFYEYNLETQKIQWDGAIEEVTGYTKKEFENVGFGEWVEMTHPDDRESNYKLFQQSLTETKPFWAQYRIKKKNNEYCWIEEDSYVVSKIDKPDRYVGIIKDITKRKKTEEALIESEKKLKEAQQLAQLGYWSWNISTGKVEWSKEVYEIFQLDPQNFTPGINSILELSPWPEDHERDKELINKAVENHETGYYEQKFLRPDGSVGYYQSTFQGNYDEKGTLIYIVGTILDITERKRAEEANHLLNVELEKRVIQRTAQLEEANKDMEAFSYSVSHDLRAPLRHIKGFINLFLEIRSSIFTEKELYYFSYITKSVDDMEKLIDGLLTFSKLSRTDLQKRHFDTMELVQSKLQLFNKDIETRVVEIKINTLHKTLGDIQLIGQVWINLISNAIKYTHKKDKAIIEIGSYSQTNETIFFIKDNGVGFNMKYANKLYGVFQRLHEQNDYEGIGIGLANVNRIITRHGGRCWAEGEPDKGATFYFSLPDE